MSRLFVLRLVGLLGIGLCAYASTAAAQLPAIPMLLVAQPQIQDPFFSHSVVLVMRHGRSRPIGIILNHPQDRAPGADGDAAGKTPYLGGPVSPLSVAYLFQTDGSVGANVLALGDKLYLGFGQDLLDDLSRRQPPLARLRVFKGISIWSQGQLEREIARGDWLPLPFETDAAFRGDISKMWRELLDKASGRAI
jgi:putative transcriptional regulator